MYPKRLSDSMKLKPLALQSIPKPMLTCKERLHCNRLCPLCSGGGGSGANGSFPSLLTLDLIRQGVHQSSDSVALMGHLYSKDTLVLQGETLLHADNNIFLPSCTSFKSLEFLDTCPCSCLAKMLRFQMRSTP